MVVVAERGRFEEVAGALAERYRKACSRNLPCPKPLVSRHVPLGTGAEWRRIYSRISGYIFPFHVSYHPPCLHSFFILNSLSS